jgi:hypothetical protein
MTIDAVCKTNARDKPNARSKVSNGTWLFSRPVDGRTATGRRFKDLVYAFANDLGGRELLSESQQQLIRRNALISALCEGMEAQAVEERQIDVNQYCVLVNCQHRLSQALGLKRVMREVEITPMDRLKQYQDARKAHIDAELSAPDAELSASPDPE